jgi:hypothetical protein
LSIGWPARSIKGFMPASSAAPSRISNDGSTARLNIETISSAPATSP